MYPKINWKNVIIFLGVVLSLWFLPFIFEIIRGMFAAIMDVFDGLSNIRLDQHGNDDTDVFKLAKLCAVFIFVGGLLRLILAFRR